MDEIKKEETSQEARIEKAEEIAEEVKIIEIKYPDDNGCTFFNWCKNINKVGLVNCTCFHPIYYMDKLERKCTQLGTTPKVVVEMPEVEQEKTTVREQIKKEILKDNKATFTVVDIIKQEVARGNKDSGLIFEALKNIFPNEKDSDLRKRIKPTISYLEKKSNK